MNIVKIINDYKDLLGLYQKRSNELEKALSPPANGCSIDVIHLYANTVLGTGEKYCCGSYETVYGLHMSVEDLLLSEKDWKHFLDEIIQENLKKIEKELFEKNRKEAIMKDKLLINKIVKLHEDAENLGYKVVKICLT